MTFAAMGALSAVARRFDLVGVVVPASGVGVLRDILTGQVPSILHNNRDLYASAAGEGALAVFALRHLSGLTGYALIAGVSVTVAVRLWSRWLGWSLPKPPE